MRILYDIEDVLPLGLSEIDANQLTAARSHSLPDLDGTVYLRGETTSYAGAATLPVPKGLNHVQVSALFNPYTLTLPLAADCGGRGYLVRSTSVVAPVTFAPQGSNSINGSATGYTIFQSGDAALITSDGTFWLAFALSTRFRMTSGWRQLIKSDDEMRGLTTTTAADNTLKLQLWAGFNYLIRGKVFFETPSSADFKWKLVGPAVGSVRVKRNWIANGGTAFGGIAVEAALGAADLAITGTGTNGFIEFEVVINNVTTSGEFQFFWAQNTSDAGSTIVKAGSYLEWTTRV